MHVHIIPFSILILLFYAGLGLATKHIIYTVMDNTARRKAELADLKTRLAEIQAASDKEGQS